MLNSGYAFFRIFLLSLVFTYGCSGCTGDKPIRVAVSKLSPNYDRWLHQNDSLVIPVNLYKLPVDSALTVLESCSGLLLTGGEDIYPGRYGKPEDTSGCTETDMYRDTLEFALFHRALEIRMPVLGICRGEQLINVALGGTLYIDIPRDFDTSVIHCCEDYTKCFHPVTLQEGSLLLLITKNRMDTVTTNHHQAVKNLAPALRANALSNDGLVEGIEWKSRPDKSFLIGIQWHPERMKKENHLSGYIAGSFIHECRMYNSHDQLHER